MSCCGIKRQQYIGVYAVATGQNIVSAAGFERLLVQERIGVVVSATAPKRKQTNLPKLYSLTR